MKVRTSVKKLCRSCKIVKCDDVICVAYSAELKYKQRQG